MDVTEAQPRNEAPNLGVVVAVRGSVVDIRFESSLPPIYSVLRTGADKKIVIEVLAQHDARHVARGMRAEDTGGARGSARPCFSPR